MDNREQTTQPAPEQPAGKGKGRLVRLAALVAVAAVVLAVAALTTMEDGAHFAGLRRWLMYGDTGATQDGYAYPVDANNRYGPLGDSLVVVNANTLQLIAGDGTVVLNQTSGMENPQLSVGGGLAAVCAVGGDTIYILDETGIIRTMNTERDLTYYAARLNGSGYLAVTEESNGYKAAVSVYDSAGTQLFHFDSYDNYLGDAIVTEAGGYLVAEALDVQDGAFASRLLVYDLATTELVSDTVIRDGLAMELRSRRDRLLCLCDNRFVITNLDGEILLDRAYGNLYLHDYTLTGDSFAALLLGRYQAGNICTLTTYDLDGTVLGTLDLTEEVLDISAAGSHLAVLYSDSLVIYDRDLTETARLDGTDYAGQVQMEEDGTALLIAGASARRFLP